LVRGWRGALGGRRGDWRGHGTHGVTWGEKRDLSS
jgi:hypothetical protein